MKLLHKKQLTSAAAILALGALAVSTVVFAGPMGGGGGAPTGGSGNMGQVALSESVITVKLESPSTGSLTRNTEFIGKIEPAQSVGVYPETAGKVTEVYFDAGQTVQKGDLLFTLDDSDAQLAYRIAQAGYDAKVISNETTLGSSYESKLLSAKTQLENAQNNLNNSRLKLADYNDGYDDSLTRAEKLRDKAYETMKTAQAAYEASNDDKDLYKAWTDAEELYEAYYADVLELENDEDSTSRDLRNSYRNAQTSYQQALDNYNLLLSGSREDTEKAVDADLHSAELSLEKSASELDKYKVYAPISGVIETRSISAHENASSQSAAFTIANNDSMTVQFNASADAAAALSIGDAITVTKSGKDYPATVVELSSKADSSTGLFPIKARLDEAGELLLNGVSVKVTAATQKAENAMLVPIDLVYYDEGQPYVYIYTDGTAHRVDITTGMSNSETIVVEGGLSADDSLITTWHPDLKDGAKVSLTGAAEAPAADPAASQAAPTADRRTNNR